MSKLGRVVAFGELLLRLSPTGTARIVQAESFDARYTGAEANVAVALTGFGWRTSLISKVPVGALGQACVNYLRRFGVATDHVLRGGDRLGTLYVETGVGVRGSVVTYDRALSSFATSTPREYDWRSILQDACWLHFSGTAPAVGPGVAAALGEGLAVARELGVTVSCDVNYRSKIWSYSEAGETMSRMLHDVDVLTGSGEDAARVFGIDLGEREIDADGLTLAGHQHVASALAKRFQLRAVAGTRRERASGEPAVIGLLYSEGTLHLSRPFGLGTNVGRIGAGDAYSAGVILGLLEAWAPDQTVEFAGATCCLKHSVVGDFALCSRDEVKAVVAHGPKTRVDR